MTQLKVKGISRYTYAMLHQSTCPAVKDPNTFFWYIYFGIILLKVNEPGTFQIKDIIIRYHRVKLNVHNYCVDNKFKF